MQGASHENHERRVRLDSYEFDLLKGVPDPPVKEKGRKEKVKSSHEGESVQNQHARNSCI